MVYLKKHKLKLLIKKLIFKILIYFIIIYLLISQITNIGVFYYLLEKWYLDILREIETEEI